MIRINDICNGAGYRDGKRITTITQPEKFDEHDLYRFQPHEQVRDTPFPYEQFPPITVSNRELLPPEYEPLKRYID